MRHEKKIKGWKLGVYSFNNNCIAVLPYFSIGRYKYQGETSIGCLNWNVQFGWIVIGFFAHSTHMPPRIKPPTKPKIKPFNIFDGLKHPTK